MVQPPEDLDLAPEAGRAQDRPELRPQDLDGHQPAELVVLGQIDPSHAAATQLLEHPIAGLQRRTDRSQFAGHRTLPGCTKWGSP